jgi:hypothetical protein
MVDKKIERFPEGILETISKIVGDNRTGTEISELINNAGYPEKSSLLGTKWRFLYDLFKNFNNQPNGQLHIAKIIQLFCDPTRWIGRETQRTVAINQINEALVFVSLQVNDTGQLIITDKKIKFERNTIVAQDSQEMVVNPIFRERNMVLDDTQCFVLMPFEPSFNRLYKDKIQPTVWSCGFKCTRADDFFSPTPIPEDIWIQICKSKVIIADVTGKNPNVFYEIGIAHTVGKPVIFITQAKNDIPFDVAHYRYFLYSDDTNGWETLCNNLRSAITPFINRKQK